MQMLSLRAICLILKTRSSWQRLHYSQRHCHFHEVSTCCFFQFIQNLNRIPFAVINELRLFWGFIKIPPKFIFIVLKYLMTKFLLSCVTETMESIKLAICAADIWSDFSTQQARADSNTPSKLFLSILPLKYSKSLKHNSNIPHLPQSLTFTIYVCIQSVFCKFCFLATSNIWEPLPLKDLPIRFLLTSFCLMMWNDAWPSSFREN